MPYPMIQTCPTCNHTLHATRLECSNCHTTIENHFEFSKFSTLNEEQLHFIEVFLLSRGNIKEVEKELGVSYPTVRGKLNDIIAKLGHRKREKQNHKTNPGLLRCLKMEKSIQMKQLNYYKRKEGMKNERRYSQNY